MNGAEQQSLPGMDMERVTFLSPSALERYRLCPRLYRFLYVDGLWRLSRSSAQQAFGTSVHAALREFFRVPVGRRSLRMLLELFKRGWVRDGYRDKEQQQKERERGAEAVGEVIEEDPLEVLGSVVEQTGADEVIVLTAPHLVEELFHRDWASRARHRVGVPVLKLLAHAG